MTNKTDWGRMAFHILKSDGTETEILVSGRERWALEALIAAKDRGCTPIDTPGPRWSSYIHDLRGMGVDIETVHEAHGEPFPGTHARYFLRAHVERVGGGV